MRAAMLVLLLSLAKPDTPPKPRVKDPPPIPVLFKTCRFGEVIQNGHDVEIRGEAWKAVGRIRDDGKLWLLWTSPGGEPCPGVYEIQGNRLSGKWGFGGRVLVTVDGDMIGDFSLEQIEGTDPPPVEF